MAVRLGLPRDRTMELMKEYIPRFLHTDWNNCQISQWECAQTPLGYRIMVGFHHKHDLNPLNRVMHMRIEDMEQLRLMFHDVQETPD